MTGVTSEWQLVKVSIFGGISGRSACSGNNGFGGRFLGSDTGGATGGDRAWAGV